MSSLNAIENVQLPMILKVFLVLKILFRVACQKMKCMKKPKAY